MERVTQIEYRHSDKTVRTPQRATETAASRKKAHTCRTRDKAVYIKINVEG